jgi:hypothetical protein
MACCPPRPLSVRFARVSTSVLSTSAGGGAEVTFGPALLDADEVLTFAQGANRKQSTASAPRTKTLAEPTGDGQSITIWNESGVTLDVVNGGYAGGDVAVAAGEKTTFTSGGGDWARSRVEAI